MSRTIVLLAAALMPLTACSKSPDVVYQPDGYRNSPEMAPTPQATATKPIVQAPPTASQRFERDFGNEGRFVYQNGFRLDTWTGCVTEGRNHVAVLDLKRRPECSYQGRTERFERDFGNEGRFVYQNGFRLDSWTGCVTEGYDQLPIMNARNEPECSYSDPTPRRG